MNPPLPKSPVCPWCKKGIELRPDATWAYMRSEATAHVVECDRRPPDSSAADLTDAVDSIMQTFRGKK